MLVSGILNFSCLEVNTGHAKEFFEPNDVHCSETDKEETDEIPAREL